MNTQINRWNPWKEMEQMQNRLSSMLTWEPLADRGEKLAMSEWMPRVDIVEDEKEFLIKAELPEMKREDVKVTVEEGVLTIAGERKMEKEEKGKRFHRVESEHGSFLRSFTLPSAVLADKVAADFKDGVLRVHLPKDGKSESRRAVEIKVA